MEETLEGEFAWASLLEVGIEMNFASLSFLVSRELFQRYSFVLGFLFFFLFLVPGTVCIHVVLCRCRVESNFSRTFNIQT